ncbi:MAG: hypothetical protein HKN37_16535 [Rhodothermales bacterium]|nr:hypothetical protein [Rhodothermales bacterium]
MKLLSKASAVVVVLLASVPLALAISLLLVPFWKWVEEQSGMESYGHSGPAGWCYAVSYLGSVVILAAVAYRARQLSARRGVES